MTAFLRMLRIPYWRQLACASLFTTTLSAAEPLKPQSISAELRESFQLAPFYQKAVMAGPMPVVSSAKVSDAALAECAWLIRQMLAHRPEVLDALAKAKVRFAVMAADEYTTDIPEHADLKPRVYWDRRARGLGATPSAPAVSGGEENLLAFPGDPYPREIISIHEFAHAIHEVGMRSVDRGFDQRLAKAFEAAKAAGLWKSTYAATNRQEYWAEATQAWFDNNDSNNALHNDIDTREELKKYDPVVAALCAEVYGDTGWRYQKPADRKPEDRAHLAGFDFSKAPRFHWRREPIPDRPRISLDCASGTIEFELTGSQDQLGRLLAQIQEGYYSGGNAAFTGDQLRLNPAKRSPDGAKIPDNEGVWRIQIGTGNEKGVAIKVVKGSEVLDKLRELTPDTATPIQRIVRLN